MVVFSQELQRIIDHDKALRNFMNVKGVTRNSGENLGQQGRPTEILASFILTLRL